MSEENKMIMRRWFEEVWNQGRADAIDELLAEDIVIHGLAGADGVDVEGANAFREFHRQFRGAFPDMSISVEQLIAEGDFVVARCSVRGSHTGETLGIVASNSAVDFEGIAICKIRDGKFVEAWNTFDFLKMNRQLGI